MTALVTHISMPAAAPRGSTVTIKTLIKHDMETGYRRDTQGRIIPRDIIVRFDVRYGGETVFAADTFPGVAANPFFAFSTVATETGDLTFTWTDMAGNTTMETRTLTVT